MNNFAYLIPIFTIRELYVKNRKMFNLSCSTSTASLFVMVFIHINLSINDKKR